MKYHLSRFAVLSLKSSSEKAANEIRVYESGYLGVHVTAVGSNGVYDAATKYARLLLAANSECDEVLAIDNEEAIVGDSLVEKHHKAIELYANLLSIQYRTSFNITSPAIYASIRPIDDEAKSHFAQAKRIRRNNLSGHNRMWPNNDLKDHFNDLVDRIDGVSLLAEALSHNHPTGQLHEFFRVIERAFGISYRKACKTVLFDYFKPSPYPISQAELDSWIKIRDTSTHADVNDFILLSDTSKVINRVELAAYDVLFNKVTWRDQDISRRKFFAPVYYPTDKEGEVVLVKGSDLKMEMKAYDGFYTYPLYLGNHFRVKLPPECIVAR